MGGLNRDSNRTLSEETWHFFRNRNRQKLVTGHYDDALLLDTQKSIPSKAFHSPRKMLILLGPRFFNPHLQSVSIPREAHLYPNGELNFPNQTKLLAKLIRKRISTLKKHFNRVFKQKDIQVLSTYSTCPIIFTWKNYGEQYWPRWVREGKCIDLEDASCSLPPGMFCVGHEERTVVMLRRKLNLAEARQDLPRLIEYLIFHLVLPPLVGTKKPERLMSGQRRATTTVTTVAATRVRELYY
ncbi:hypothetical protein ACTXT7_005947 [Hymenolepis weldensis]